MTATPVHQQAATDPDGPTGRLASWVAGLRLGDIPETVVERAKHKQSANSTAALNHCGHSNGRQCDCAHFQPARTSLHARHVNQPVDLR